MQKNIKESFSKTLLAIGIASVSTISSAGSFGLIEQSASGQGSAYAGASAIAEDASTIYFNPAGMTKLTGSQLVVAGHIVAAEADYTDSGSTGLGIAGSPNSSSDEIGFIPNFYYSTALENDVFFGVGVNVPYGLATEYDDGWIGRYHALRSEIATININPSIAWKATNTVSIGFGLNIQYLEIELTSSLNTAALCTGFGGGATCGAASVGDSAVKFDGDSLEIGWNVGVLIDLEDEKSRLGIAYRSAIKHAVSGDADYTVDPALRAFVDTFVKPTLPPLGYKVFEDTSLDAAAALPETFSLSYVSEASKQLTLLLDWTWTGWSSLDSVTIVQANGLPGQEPTLDLNYTDTNRFSIGAHYQPNATWIYRYGLALDETPIRSPESTSARIPGNDRTWLSFGVGYMPAGEWSFDFGYSHLFLDDIDINNANVTGETLVGSYEADVNILSAQANMKF